MSWEGDALLVTGVFLALMLGGMWVPFCIALAACLYMWLSWGPASFKGLGLVSWGSTNSFTLTAIPLFILMAEVLLQSGLSHRVYRGLSLLVQRLPGGLLQTNIAGCAVFSAISGSSVATAAAIGTVALPQLAERGYEPRLAAGTLAAGGTLGILIPPSIAMIIYGSFTETSVAKLFMAGVLPGLLLTGLFMLYVGFRVALSPGMAPRERVRLGAAEWLTIANDLLPFAVLIGTVLVSLYFGFATPTEAAAVGCLIAIPVALIWGDLPLAGFRRALRNTVRSSGGIMFIVLAAFLFSYAAGMAGLAHNMTAWLVGLGLDRYGFLLVLFCLYVVLGCVVDSIGMMVITVPLLFPILLQYGIDPIWFGVVLVLLVELGQITPPLGINLFVIQSIRTSGRLEDVIAGSVPFYVIIVVMLVLLALLPELALWLPERMISR